MAFSVFGDPIFGILDGKVATRVATNSYGTAVDVQGIQMMRTRARTVSGEGAGDDRLVAAASRIIAAEYEVRFLGAAIEVYEIITGVSSASSLTSPNRVRRWRLQAGQSMPWFGLVGQGLAEEGNGDVLLFGPQLKIMEGLDLSMNEYGNFEVLSFTALGIHDATYGIFNRVPRETTGSYTLPPANIGTL